MENLLNLPTELLVLYHLIPNFNTVNLRYVSSWLRCVTVTEETPSLWKEFVWPYYNSCEECSLKEVLNMCGQHISFLTAEYRYH